MTRLDEWLAIWQPGRPIGVILSQLALLGKAAINLLGRFLTLYRKKYQIPP
jgi:hypothetical protein